MAIRKMLNSRWRWIAAALLVTVAAQCAASGNGRVVWPHRMGQGLNNVESGPQNTGPMVVLLHGLARTKLSLGRMEKALLKAGYQTCNIGYPSRHYTVEELAERYVLPAIVRCQAANKNSENREPLHFVTHSMGGIILRQLLAAGLINPIANSVMLAPPNKGSELVDKLANLWIYDVVNGPAGNQLGTLETDLPKRLGPITGPVGVIAGTKNRSPMLSLLMNGEHDGKVSVASAHLDGQQDFIRMHVTHTFMMRNDDVIGQTKAFLANGQFHH